MPIVPLVIATFFKALTFASASSVHIEGLEHLIAALKKGRGVLTVSNHISVIDEPAALATAVPLKYFLDERTTRWTLGAADVLFLNAPLRAFFNAGQVIETFRSRHQPEKAGIYQPAVDRAVEKLDSGRWLHIFPEGYIHQHPAKELLYFRWGVSRMLMETKGNPEIIPMWIEGFDTLMPEPRNAPKFVPRFWHRPHIRIIFGQPITDRLRTIVQQYKLLQAEDKPKTKLYTTASAEKSAQNQGGPVNEAESTVVDISGHAPAKSPAERIWYAGEPEVTTAYRIEIAAILKEEVEALGRKSGSLRSSG